MDNRVLVTGGAGFIGYHTVQKLLSKGYEVTVFDNLSTGNIQNLYHLNGKVNFIYGDLLNYEDIANAVQNQDYIIHVGAVLSVPESMNRPELYQGINTQGSFNLLYLAYKAGIKKVVLASSCAVEGNSYYGLSKKMMEDIAGWFNQITSLKTVCLRYMNVYGERQTSIGEGAVVPAFHELLLNNESPIIHGDGLQTRDFVYVKDIAEANLHALENDFTGITYIATGKETSILDLLETMQIIMQKSISPIFEERRPGDMMSVGFHYPEEEFGWSPKYNLKQGLENYIKNYE